MWGIKRASESEAHVNCLADGMKIKIGQIRLRIYIYYM